MANQDKSKGKSTPTRTADKTNLQGQPGRAEQGDRSTTPARQAREGRMNPEVGHEQHSPSRDEPNNREKRASPASGREDEEMRGSLESGIRREADASSDADSTDFENEIGRNNTDTGARPRE